MMLCRRIALLIPLTLAGLLVTEAADAKPSRTLPGHNLIHKGGSKKN